MTTTTKTEFQIRGLTSGWLRGPFKTGEAAGIAAAELSREKSEVVRVALITTTTTVRVEEVSLVTPSGEAA